MLIAPFTVPASSTARASSSRRIDREGAKRRVLLAWLALGAMALLLVPMLRGGRTLGGTLPFWLVAAPLVDLAFLGRARIAAFARDALRAFGERRSMSRRVRSVRDPRAGVGTRRA
jgi:hypothetical protein